MKDILVGQDTKTITGTKDTSITIDFIDAFNTYILSIENHEITECAFATKNSNYDEVSIHTKDENGMKNDPPPFE